jgi:hypothetical protein
MRFILLLLAVSLTSFLPQGTYSAEIPQANLVPNDAFITFTTSSLNPSILIRIPFSGIRFDIRTREEFKAPLGRYVDAKIPLSYHLSNNLFFHLTGTMERVYLMQAPSEIVQGNGWGVPLSTMYGSVQSQQAVVEFGFTFGF